MSSSSSLLDAKLGPAKSRRTRFVCISDTHNHTVKLPKGDVLIHAGDLTNQGSHSEVSQLSKAIAWLDKADFEAKIVVAGNHDVSLDADFFAHRRAEYGDADTYLSADCHALLTKASSLTYLCHESTQVRLANPSGPHTSFTAFGSPYSPRHVHGSRPGWAFGYSCPDALGPDDPEPSLWDQIPLDTDVVVTHTPPRGHCDRTDSGSRAGCEALRRTLSRVRPRLVVCGHVHSGRGSERVRWALDDPSRHYSEEACAEVWTDPGAGSNKISLVDLTGRRGGRVLDAVSRECQRGVQNGLATDQGSTSWLPGVVNLVHAGAAQKLLSTAEAGLVSSESINRTERHETCIVNCAIAATNYPHTGGRRYNKPIVVDVDLPVWGEDQSGA